MIHCRIGDEIENAKARFACGIVGVCNLPEGDTYFFESELAAAYKVDCPGCNPGGPRELGTPISQLSGRLGHPGYEEFRRIADSWGY